VRRALAEYYPDINPGEANNYASQLFKFVSEMAIGELIIYPLKLTSKIYLGKISGDYKFDSAMAPERPHIRDIS